MSDRLFIGLMSGTSMDGIDAVLVRNPGGGQEILGHHHTPWPDELRTELRALAAPGDAEIDKIGQVDVRAGGVFADAVENLLNACPVDRQLIVAIGSHGQTIRHRPSLPTPFTLQIGDPNVIAERTGISVVADFRRRDMAAGGEGAPLVPAYHEALFRTDLENRVILNIGGIANLTALPADRAAGVIGFDTGPGNTLMDYWIRRQRGLPFDQGGDWAATGTPDEGTLRLMLDDDYFRRFPPKSTGPEYFSPAWLAACLPGDRDAAAEDIQATLTALTARSAARAISDHAPGCQHLICCGGGARNGELLRMLGESLTAVEVTPSSALGIDPELIEPAAFAWMAHETLAGRPGNLPRVTGARHPAILGAIHQA